MLDRTRTLSALLLILPSLALSLWIIGYPIYDVVYTSLAFYALGDNVEQLSVTTASGTYAAGNSVNNLIVGNAGADALAEYDAFTLRLGTCGTWNKSAKSA